MATGPPEQLNKKVPRTRAETSKYERGAQPMNQNQTTRTSYDAPRLLTEDPVHAMFRELSADNKMKAIKFVETLKATQRTPGP